MSRSIVKTVGGLLATVGGGLLLYVTWQFWWTSVEATATQAEVVQTLSEQFDDHLAQESVSADPVVGQPPAAGQPFGIVYIPKFGEDFAVPVSAGVGSDVLDQLGLGMYPQSAMPGGVGNFAVAGHRQTHGKVLDLIHTLVPGDRIYVRTDYGYYTYELRDHEIVAPDQTGVLLPVPHKPDAVATERLMTLTTCHPRFSDRQRHIAYAVMTSWQPGRTGPPAEIAGTVALTAKG